jgi:signal transduction histidine kinase/ligand-binding sensor domain-containing protein
VTDASEPPPATPRRISALLGLVLALAPLACAGADSRIRFHRIDRNYGELPERVRQIAVDSGGFVWMVAEDSLWRFDGTRFRRFGHDPARASSLPHGLLDRIEIDGRDRVWISSRTGGVCRFETASETCIHYREDASDPARRLPSDQVVALAVRAGRLWIRHPTGVRYSTIDLADDRVAPLPFELADAGAVQDFAFGIENLAEGVGFRLRERMLVWRPPASRLEAVPPWTFDVSLAAGTMVLGPDGDLWLNDTIERAVLRIDTDGRVKRRYGVADGALAGNTMNRSMLAAGGEVMWVTLTHGLARISLRDGTVENFVHDPADPVSLPEGPVRALGIGRRGEVWVATPNGLAVHLPDSARFGLLRHRSQDSESLPTNYVLDARAARDGAIWLGTPGGLVEYREDRGVVARHAPGAPGAPLPVDGVAVGDDGAVWALTPSGLFRLPPDRAGFEALKHDPADPTSIAEPFVNQAFVDSRGTLWLQGVREGTISVRCAACEGFRRFRHDPADPSTPGPQGGNGFHETRDGAVWALRAASGLERVDPERGVLERHLHDPSRADSLCSDNVTSMAELADGSVWLGTDRGLCEMRGRGEAARFRAIGAAQGLASDLIATLLADADGVLWMGTGAGTITRYDPRRGEASNHAPLDGVQGVRFQVGRAWPDRVGRLLFPTTQGLLTIDPNETEVTAAAPKVVLTALRVFNEVQMPRAIDPHSPLPSALSQLRRLDLYPHQGLFGLEFAAPEVGPLPWLRYEYRMDGLEERWVPAIARQPAAWYSHLPAGDYVFRVRAATDSTATFGPETRLALTVHAPWWRTRLAYAIYALLAALAIGHWVARYRSRLALERFAALKVRESEETLRILNVELESRVQERTRDLQQTTDDLRETLDKLGSAQAELIESARLASLGRLVAGVAHEINTPLGVGVTAATHLQDEIERLYEEIDAGADAAQLRGLRATVSRANRLVVDNLMRADRLVRSFKDIAVDSASEQSREVDLADYLREIVMSLQPILRESPHRVEIACPENWCLDTYPGALHQIVSNLILNSIAHGYPQGGAGTFRIEARAIDAEVELDYRDDGRGLSEEEIARVFEPFFTTRRGHGGSGLGMHIAYNAAARVLKGSIRCVPAAHGAHFVIRFPAR